MRIILEPISTVRSATIGVWIGTGSRHETEINNGISHFLEHMFFKGTDSRSAKEIAEAFDQVGGQVNAFTSKEYTCLYARVLDAHAEYAINVLADMLFQSSFDNNELTKEKQVVYEEIKMYEDTPDDIVHDLLSEASFGDHPLGYPILGTESTLKTFETQSLRDYMYTNYNPERIVISVAGNVSEDFIKVIESLFNHYEAAPYSNDNVAPLFYKEKIARKKDTEQAHLCLGYNGLELGNPDIYRLVTLNNILGGSMSSRLFQDVREERGLAYSIFSYHTAFQDSGLFTIYGGTGANQIDKLYETIMTTLDQLIKNGLTEKEIQNSKEQLKGNLMLSLESTSSRMSRNAKNELLLQRHRQLDEITAEIDSVQLDEVNDMAKQLFVNDFSCAVISPTGDLPKLMK